jgi:hypothetical protein
MLNQVYEVYIMSSWHVSDDLNGLLKIGPKLNLTVDLTSDVQVVQKRGQCENVDVE